ncbi:peptidylprolyl isomerase [Candidatus Parcubacteria bacterium]|nr:MAG: peptidylprolyl isomerase [Candidatus Parcubacteria bacterium]
MKQKLTIVLLIIIFGVGLYFLIRPKDETKENMDLQNTQPVGRSAATLNTTMGEIKIVFYNEDAPQTVANFISLASKDFYNGLPFHRVVEGFVVQAGDPFCAEPPRGTGRCGTGGPGYRFEDELNPNTPSYREGYKKGVVAMANSGPDTNGSQFFILLEDAPYLPHDYTIFGRVVEGQDVVDAMGRVEVDESERPKTPIVIESIRIEN